MRVLLVVHGFPPQALGGTEIYTHDLARTLARHFDEEVFVVTREAVPEKPEYGVRREDREGVRIFFINHTFRHCRSYEETYRNPLIRAAVAKLVDQIRPDVVHIQHLTCLSTDLVMEFARRRIPTFFTLNDYWLLCQRGQLLDLDLERCPGPTHGCRRCADAAAAPGGVQKMAPVWRRLEAHLPRVLAAPLGRWVRGAAQWMSQDPATRHERDKRVRHVLWLSRHVTLFLAPSHTLRRRFVDFGVDATRIRYLPQGIRQPAFAHTYSAETRSCPGSGAELRIGFLGSLMVSKAPHLLLEAFSRLPRGSASLQVYGALAGYHGDDSYGQRLEPLLQTPGVQHHGAIPHSQVTAALAAVDVLVVPSIWLENAPFVIRESFRAGVPVVTSNLGGMAEMVEHEGSGLLFEPGDSDDLLRCLRRLLAEPALLPRLRAGIPKVMTMEEDAAQLRDLYQSPLSWPQPVLRPSRLAVVILNFRTPHDTVLAVRSVESSQRRVEEIIVVDNDDEEASGDFLSAHLGSTKILRTGTNLGFSGGCNVGLRAALEAGADLVLLLNADAFLAAECVGRLEEALASQPEYGIAGPVVLAAHDPCRVVSRGTSFSSLDGRMRHLGVAATYRSDQSPPTREVTGVDGCALMIKRQVMEEVGLLDEDYFFSFEDLDLCLRSKQSGYATLCVGDAIVYHLGSRSIGARSPQRIYYGARNHLLLARRRVPLPRALSWLRGAWIVALNLAHVARGGCTTRGEGLRAVLRGTYDHVRQRYGPLR